MSLLSDSENTIPKPIIFLDWDDTILPSTWLTDFNISLHTDIPEVYKTELETFENTIYKLFLSILENANIIIVTNAEKKWITMSSNKFLPKICPLLENIDIISARDLYCTEYPENPDIWKINVFTNTILQIINKYSYSDAIIDIISIGDSIYERNAIHYSTYKYKDKIRTKSFKFIDKPNIKQLEKQLGLFHSCLQYILNQHFDLDLMLTIDLIK